MKFTANLLKFLLVSLFLSLPFLSHAFQEGSTNAQDSTGIQQPRAISVNRLVPEMEELRSLINLNARKIVPSARLKRIDSLYPVYKSMVEEEGRRTREFLVSNPNQQKINNLIRRWEEFRVCNRR